MRSVSVELEDLLDLVHASDTYGYDRSIFLGAMADWAGYVTDEEIENFATLYASEEYVVRGYGEEDVDDARDTLRAWRNKYCKKEITP